MSDAGIYIGKGCLDSKRKKIEWKDGCAETIVGPNCTFAVSFS